MIIILVLILTEALSLAVLRQHFFLTGRTRYYVLVVLHIILSLWIWILVIKVFGHNTFFDTPDNIWNIMALAGMVCAVVLPRILLVILHFTGKWIKREKGGHIRWLTNAGIIISFLVLIVIGLGTFRGKLNFRYENVDVKIRNLHPDLEGLRIVHISDLHLAGFYHHGNVLADVFDRINRYEPDLILNTGDFVSIGWREFGRNDTVMLKGRSRYGNYAIMGNHDAGSYHPEYSEAELRNHKIIMNNLVSASGYTVLNDQHARVKVGNAVIGIIGVTTGGRHPDITHGSIENAIAGLDSVDFQILLTHDPNHWIEDIRGKHNEIKLSFSGHTHGMQMGIMTKKLKWSPSQYFYPNWNGLYTSGEQLQYVNRGLGVLAIPFRLWMPPEITILTLRGE